MKLKSTRMMGIVIIALLLSGCGAKSQEDTEEKSDIHAKETVSARTDSAASKDISPSEAETSSSGEAAQADGTLITEDEAKDIALKDACLTQEQISGIRISLETDDGRRQYEVSFYAGDQEYDYDIDAVTGKILSKDMEIADDYQQPGSQNVAVSETEVKKTALKKVPGAGEDDIKIHLDHDDGKVLYEGSIVYKERKYEFEIDADTGSILKWEEESVFD